MYICLIKRILSPTWAFWRTDAEYNWYFYLSGTFQSFPIRMIYSWWPPPPLQSLVSFQKFIFYYKWENEKEEKSIYVLTVNHRLMIIVNKRETQIVEMWVETLASVTKTGNTGEVEAKVDTLIQLDCGSFDPHVFTLSMWSYSLFNLLRQKVSLLNFIFWIFYEC